MATYDFKKDVDYSDNRNNYVIDGEITVTITLAEYRELVSVKATTDKLVKDAEKDRYERNTENATLKQENAKLKFEMYKLKKLLEEKEVTE